MCIRDRFIPSFIVLAITKLLLSGFHDCLLMSRKMCVWPYHYSIWCAIINKVMPFYTKLLPVMSLGEMCIRDRCYRVVYMTIYVGKNSPVRTGWIYRIFVGCAMNILRVGSFESSLYRFCYRVHSPARSSSTVVVCKFLRRIQCRTNQRGLTVALINLCLLYTSRCV